MSLKNQAATARPRRRWSWVLVAVALLAVVATGAFLLGRSGSGGTAAPAVTPQPAPAAPTSPPVPQTIFGELKWENVAGSPVATSSIHGPRERIGPVAKGFSHDEAGAVLATMNIGARLSSSAGASTYEPVLQHQAYGDPHSTRYQFAHESSSTPPGKTAPRQWWWKVVAGDPRGEWVRVSLVAKTPQADQMGGYVQIIRTLSWKDRDWKMRVPPSRPSLTTSIAGHQSVE